MNQALFVASKKNGQINMSLAITNQHTPEIFRTTCTCTLSPNQTIEAYVSKVLHKFIGTLTTLETSTE